MCVSVKKAATAKNRAKKIESKASWRRPAGDPARTRPRIKINNKAWCLMLGASLYPRFPQIPLKFPKTPPNSPEFPLENQREDHLPEPRDILCPVADNGWAGKGNQASACVCFGGRLWVGTCDEPRGLLHREEWVVDPVTIVLSRKRKPQHRPGQDEHPHCGFRGGCRSQQKS